MKAQMVDKKVILVENKKAKSQVWKCFGFVKDGGNLHVSTTQVECRLYLASTKATEEGNHSSFRNQSC